MDLIIPVFTFIASLLFVILFIGLGWYIVWKLFLSKFKFVRELLGQNGSESADDQTAQRQRVKKRRD